jgi:lipid-binding SYLF domain-containing protein
MSAFVESLKRTAIGSLLLFALALLSAPAMADPREELDAHARLALQDLYRLNAHAKDVGAKAAGILVFPNVVKAGFLFGAEYGEGALLVGGSSVAHYNIISASFGLQAGVQDESVALMFKTPEALNKFRASYGWKAGLDGSIAIVTVGAGGELDTETLQKPVVAFVFDNKGLMANLSLQGSKISLIDTPGLNQARRDERGGKASQVADTAPAKTK